MSLSALETIVKCAPRRALPHAIDEWMHVERTIGVALPADYRAFIDKYGVVQVDDFLLIYSPFSDHEHANLVLEARAQAEMMRQSEDRRGVKFPVELFPTPGGLIYWGRTANGDMLAWESRPAIQRIVVHDVHAEEFEWHDQPVTEFLAAVLSRRIQVRFFPDNFPYIVHSCLSLGD